MGLCLNIFSIGQGVREKYLTAKGVRSPKSLGTADLEDLANAAIYGFHCILAIVLLPFL